MSLFILSQRQWPAPLRLSGATALLLLIALTAINLPLINAAAPRGIVSFELAATSEQALAIAQSWAGVRHWATLSLYLDFVFIGAYLLFLLKLTRHWLIDRPGVREKQVGRWARNLFVVAAITDVGENISLLVTLEQPRSDIWPLVAALLALTKFSGLLAGAGALLVVRAARGQPLRSQS